MNRLHSQIHPLLTEEVVGTLHAKQVFTAADFIKAEAQQLVKTARLNFKEVLALKKFLTKNFAPTPVNGLNYYKSVLSNSAIIPTGINSVDHILNGGLFTGNVYEICGLPNSGKTQFSLSLMKNVVQNMQQQVYFFDTKSDFSAIKAKKLFSGHNQEHLQDYLSKVTVFRTYTRHELINGLYEVKNNLENDLKLRLIIIDSLPA
ncbi:DNA repair protein RAD51 homolog 4-like isoform X2 [Tenebrio molitor]